jgi:hypothetical protein
MLPPLNSTEFSLAQVAKEGVVMWSCVQFVNFKFVPQKYQNTFMDAVCFGWDIYMALSMAKAKEGADGKIEDGKDKKAA